MHNLEAGLDMARGLLTGLDQIHLVSILPDKKSITGRNFGIDVAAALEWAKGQNDLGNNIYWTVNSVEPDCHRKPTKKQILSARFCHVDIDPPKNSGPWIKENVIAILQKAPCPASFIINSGNGLQAFWRLKDSVKSHEIIEELNAAIACQIGGDACHNIDRLMRLPGLVNFPNKAKASAGRVPVHAVWEQTENGAAYTLVQLQAAFASTIGDEDSALAQWRRRTERPNNEELIAKCKHGANWHNDMIVLVARSVKRGLTDAEILDLAPPITQPNYHVDQTRQEMLTAIRGARIKWPNQSRCDSSGILLDFANASDTSTVALEYLIDPFLPTNCVVGFSGRGGTAKSSLLATLAASISDVASTLWVSVEEPNDWIKARHIKTGGAENTLAVVSAVPSKRDSLGRVIASNFNTYEHLELAILSAKAAFETHHCPPRSLRLVVLDTAVGLTDWAKGESPNDDAAVKRLLGHFQALAEKYDLTIAFIHHANKGKHDHFADTVMGASAWTNSPRLSFVHATNRRQEYAYVLRVAKSNLTTPFAASYSTAPVHTLHSRSVGADSVLCRVDLGEVVWGSDASMKLFEDATRKPLDEDSTCRGSLVGAVALEVAELVQNSVQPITRELVEAQLGRIVSRREWTKVDARLAQHGIEFARGEKNRVVYLRRGEVAVTQQPTPQMW